MWSVLLQDKDSWIILLESLSSWKCVIVSFCYLLHFYEIWYDIYSKICTVPVYSGDTWWDFNDLYATRLVFTKPCQIPHGTFQLLDKTASQISLKRLYMFDVRFSCWLLPPVWQRMSVWSVLAPRSKSICPASPVSNHHPFLLQPVMKIICLAGAETQHETSTSNKSCCQQWGLQDLSRSGRMKPYLHRPATQAVKVKRAPIPPKKPNPARLGWVHFCCVKSRGLDKRLTDLSNYNISAYKEAFEESYGSRTKLVALCAFDSLNKTSSYCNLWILLH